MLSDVSLPQMTLFLYSLFNMLRVVSYIPQIWRIAQDTEGAQAISYTTWALWVGANLSTALYAWVNLHDVPLALLNGANAFCCGVVIALTFYKRASMSQRNAAGTAISTGFNIQKGRSCP